MTTKKTLVLSTAIATLLSALAVSTTQAASISWGAAKNITNDSDVFNAWPIVGAFNVGETPLAIPLLNSVNFQPFAVPLGGTTATVGNFTLDAIPTAVFLPENTVYGSASAPFSGLTPKYQTLLQSATVVGGGSTNSFTLTMNNLSVGCDYTFQWWANSSGPFPPPNGTDSQTHSATAGNTVILDDNDPASTTTGFEGGLGQYAIGTFTADSTTQVITFTGVPTLNNSGLLNGFLLAVPEPTTALFGLALFGVCCGGRRRPSRGSVKA